MVITIKTMKMITHSSLKRTRELYHILAIKLKKLKRLDWVNFRMIILTIWKYNSSSPWWWTKALPHPTSLQSMIVRSSSTILQLARASSREQPIPMLSTKTFQTFTSLRPSVSNPVCITPMASKQLNRCNSTILTLDNSSLIHSMHLKITITSNRRTYRSWEKAPHLGNHRSIRIMIRA